MLSGQILQNTIDGLKSVTRRDIVVIERDGKIAASTTDENIDPQLIDIDAFLESQAESQVVAGNSYFKVLDNSLSEYVVMVFGEDDETYRIGKIAAFQIQSLLIAYKERYDKDNFIKNLLLDNLLLVDIYSRAKKLHIENNVRRTAFLIDSEPDSDMSIIEIVRNMFPSKLRDFVAAVDERSIILVKELREKDGIDEVTRIARTISDTLSAESLNRVTVAIGSSVSDLKNVSNSYKEARMALEVGKIFEPDKTIVNYEQLGIGRLIYQLPASLCKMFVNEVLRGQTVEQFEDELLATVNKFFENNLNVSETSRQLYIHRNTLVYRLDKLQKLTGLDLRVFDDAIIFKITMMVYKYMNYKDSFLF